MEALSRELKHFESYDNVFDKIFTYEWDKVKKAFPQSIKEF